MLIQNNGKLDSDWAMLVGGGLRRKLTQTIWTRLLTKIFKACSKAGFSRIAICLDADGSLPEKELTDLVGEVYAKGKYAGIEYLLTLVPVSSD